MTSVEQFGRKMLEWQASTENRYVDCEEVNHSRLLQELILIHCSARREHKNAQLQQGQSIQFAIRGRNTPHLARLHRYSSTRMMNWETCVWEDSRQWSQCQMIGTLFIAKLWLITCRWRQQLSQYNLVQIQAILQRIRTCCTLWSGMLLHHHVVMWMESFMIYDIRTSMKATQ